jgi:hypothetical protein
LAVCGALGYSLMGQKIETDKLCPAGRMHDNFLANEVREAATVAKTLPSRTCLPARHSRAGGNPGFCHAPQWGHWIIEKQKHQK